MRKGNKTPPPLFVGQAAPFQRRILKDLELLSDKKILVVEDEYFLAREMEVQLEALGVEVIGPAATVNDAMNILTDNKQIDGAILDINLRGELVYPVADLLQRLDIPFVFATGRSPADVPDRYPGFILCEKPTQLSEIARALFASRGPASH